MAIAEKSQSSDWKDKYFKALNEFDLEGRRRADQLTRVSRDLLGVLEKFRGLDGEFDHDLDPLVRSRQLDLDDEQARLRDLVQRFERAALHARLAAPVADASRADETRDPALPFRELIGAIAGPAPVQAALAELKGYLERATAQAAQAELVATVAARLSDILALPGAERTVAARETLQTLVDHLSLPEASQARLTALTPQLQQAQDGASVRRIARDLADFLAEYVGNMHAEIASLSGFLVVIKARLAEVSGFLIVESTERGLAAGARHDLDKAMERTLTEMRDQVAEATDLDRLKHDIQNQLSLIDGNVAAYIKSEAARAARQESEQDTLQRQLGDLEQQSEQLRRKLADAQARATRDTLTGLPNRLAFKERAKVEYARAQRDGRALSVAILDIDHFKRINDTFGHQAGDRVLKHLARELGTQVRAQDFFGRYGGEEFILLLPDTRCDGALVVLDKLRRHLEGCRFKFKDAPVNVTFSCGVAEVRDTESTETAIARADAALYVAKRNGRNRVEREAAA